MKNLTLLFTSLLLVATSLPARGQGKADDAAKAKPADPFIKDQKGKVDQPAGAKGAPTGNQITNVGLVMQHIDVKRERWQKWLSENSAPGDATKLRGEVETWITAGDATLAETSLVMGKSGDRSKVESVRQLYFPGAFDQSKSGLPFPHGSQVKNLGSTLEVDLLMGADGAVEVQVVPERVAYSGEVPPRQEIGVEAGDIRWPSFRSQRVHCAMALAENEWALLGSEASLDGKTSHTTLIFARPIVHQFEERTVPGNPGNQGMLTFESLEVGHEQLNNWLMNAGDISGWVGGALHAKAREAGATILDERVLRFKSGQRVKNESIVEVTFPTEYHADAEGILPAKPDSLDVRNIGITVEADPVFGKGGGTLELNLAPEKVLHFGSSVHHRVRVIDEWVPNVTFPIFYLMKTTTQVTLPLDSHVLISVLSPPDETGNINPNRKVLQFVKVSR